MARKRIGIPVPNQIDRQLKQVLQNIIENLDAVANESGATTTVVNQITRASSSGSSSGSSSATREVFAQSIDPTVTSVTLNFKPVPGNPSVRQMRIYIP